MSNVQLTGLCHERRAQRHNVRENVIDAHLHLCHGVVEIAGVSDTRGGQWIRGRDGRRRCQPQPMLMLV